MSTRKVWGKILCKCEACGNVWISRHGKALPARCPVCGAMQRIWNASAYEPKKPKEEAPDATENN